MDIVECGKLVAVCKVFQHHSPTFPFIPYHLTPSLIILHHSLSSYIIQHHSTPFPFIPHYPTTFSPILPYSHSFYNIPLHLLSFPIILQHSSSFPNIRQNHFSTRNFCHLLSNKKLVVCCIINMILSVYYYQLNIINILLSIS